MRSEDVRGAAVALPRTIASAARQVRTRAISCVELAQACLHRIDQLDPIIQACLTVMRDTALEEARTADAELAAGRDRSPLQGIPFGIKDIIAMRGVRTTGGSRVLADWLPDEDATIVTRLAAAGAVALCKTNTHEFAYGTITPPTRNPWNTAHSPGGSSGGSAAAIATGECLGALGTDTAGSIRIPAAACGVTGLKPTAGLVSCAGILPLSWSLDHAGPIARTAEDCALILDAIAGYDPHDPNSVDVASEPFAATLKDDHAPEQAARGICIGIPSNYFFRSIDPAVASAVRQAIEVFAALGARVVDVDVPAAIDDLYAVYRAIQRPEAYTFHRDKGWLEARAELYSPEVRANLELGAGYSASDYIRAQRARRAFTDEMGSLMRTVDVLLTPTLPVPARRIDELDQPLLFDGRQEPAGHALRLTFPFDITGQPALTVPCGFSPAGLPIGLQIIANHFRDALILRLGHAFQHVTQWHTTLPLEAEAYGS